MTCSFVTRSLVVAAALAASALPAAADDGFRTVQYRPFTQTTVTCPANLLCVLRLQPGERIRSGLNSGLAAWESNDVYEGGDEQTPLLTFKPAAPGQRANVVLTTDRRTYLVLLESNAGTRPTYIRFAFDEETRSRARRQAQASQPQTIAEQLEATCSWFSTNAAGEGYALDSRPEVPWHPVRVCHDARATWIALAPSATVAGDLPVVLEVTTSGERIVNYSVFGAERLIRVDGVSDGYVLRSGRDVLRVRRVTPQATSPARASAPSAPSAPEAAVSTLLRGADHGP